MRRLDQVGAGFGLLFRVNTLAAKNGTVQGSGDDVCREDFVPPNPSVNWVTFCLAGWCTLGLSSGVAVTGRTAAVCIETLFTMLMRETRRVCDPSRVADRVALVSL